MPDKKPKYDEKIMAELLEQPGVKENVAKMSPEMLEWFKELLVKQGVYIRYVSERQDAQIKKILKGRGKH